MKVKVIPKQVNKKKKKDRQTDYMVQMVYIRISSKADIKISLKADEEGKKK